MSDISSTSTRPSVTKLKSLMILGQLAVLGGLCLRAFNHGRIDAGKPTVYAELVVALTAGGALLWLAGFLSKRRLERHGRTAAH